MSLVMSGAKLIQQENDGIRIIKDKENIFIPLYIRVKEETDAE
jgi:hypothetical protein